MVEAFTARSGAPSLRIDGVAVHSPYDPVREAARFASEALGAEPPSAVIVLGEALGHVGAAVAALFPAARVLCVRYSPQAARIAIPPVGPAWDPSSPAPLSEFLRGSLGELDVEGLRVIEWQPCARLFPVVSLQANDAVRQVVHELTGSFTTTVGAGRRWVRNGICNLIAIEAPLSGRLCAPARPVVVCAPGPSLESCVEPLRSVRPLVDLWALPSSIPCLAEAGLAPDLVVLTDPGYYAVHHMQFDPVPCPVAMPISAARGTWRLKGHYLLAQPDAFERELLAAAGLRPPVIPPHGTVAATALDLALASTTGPVIAAGLDLCFRDLLSHARPNAFDRLLLAQSGRLRPHESLLHARAASQNAVAAPGRGGGARVSSALRTYAGWFDGMAAGDRAHRLLPSTVALRGMRNLAIEGLAPLAREAVPGPGGPRLSPVRGYPGREERIGIAQRLMRGWREAIRDTGGALSASEPAQAPSTGLELSYLISPRLLVDARRKARIGDPDGARTAWSEMVDDCVAFLDGIMGRIADG
jgi:hypothetical protein